MNHQSTKSTKEEASRFIPVPEQLDQLAAAAVDCAYKVHRALGPGLLESVYETCLAHELSKRGYPIQTQVRIPVQYDGIKLDAGLRIDLLVDSRLIVEVKAVEHLTDVHKAQLLTYLKLTGNRLGLLINFNVATIKTGIKRLVF
jgi:GxxExxY protein